MKKFTRTLRFAAWSTVLLAPLTWADTSIADTTTNPDMIQELRASGPNPSLGAAGTAWGRLVGSWSVAYSFTSKSGTVTHKSGSYSAGWVMDGRAVQDVWTVDPSEGRTEREIYTTLRYVDSKSRTLCATFVDPEYASIAKFTGGTVGDDRIVTLTHDLGVATDDRWSFNDISATSMVFRDEQSKDSGKTWRVVEEDRFTRRSAASATPDDMTGVLRSAGPHLSLGDRVKLFDALAGTWNGQYTSFSKDGKTTRSLGEWTFGWVMDGRAMQDLFIINPSVTLKERYVGVSLRYFDPKSRTWSVTFIDPEYDVVETLTGGAVGDDRIVLSSQGADGKQRRWSLVDIRRDSWVFRDETSLDGGKTWRLIEEDHMTRHGADQATL